MKTFKMTMVFLSLCAMGTTHAQNKDKTDKVVDKESYYEQRAEEDAKYEQKFTADSKKDEQQFWEDQKNYEKDLKKRDRKAYRAYMNGKRDAYAEHYNHCDHSCHHSDYYYNHASFYYHRYYYYDRYPNRNSTSTSVRIGTPSVRLGF
ncbi:hypothetical protein ACS386_07350 [Flavobacteriaceae bacterium LMO-SS05]